MDIRRSLDRSALALAVCLALGAAVTVAAQTPSPSAGAVAAPNRDQRVIYRVRPSEADPTVQRFDEPHYVAFDRPAPDTELVVMMTGTGGQAEYMAPQINFLADQGYRGVSISFPTQQAVVQICSPVPDPDCSGDFRRKRIYGEGDFALIDDALNETIAYRLTMLLRHLDRTHPDEGWGAYLDGDKPNWSRIIVSGQSQGAGMAAYIAKRELVARAVLFSSPWDYSPGPTLAAWLDDPSVTPPDRWYGFYHRDETAADLLAQSYAILGIPADHIKVVDLDSGLMDVTPQRPNPYHVIGIRDPRMIEDWRRFFGRGRPAASAAAQP